MNTAPASSATNRVLAPGSLFVATLFSLTLASATLVSGPVRAQSGEAQPVASPALAAPDRVKAQPEVPEVAQTSIQHDMAQPAVSAGLDGEPDSPSSSALADPPVSLPPVPVSLLPVPVSSVPLSAAPEPSTGGSLQTSLLVEIETERPDVAVSVAIFGDEESFQSGENPVRTLSLDQNSTVARAFVLNLPAGRYAIVAWQDLDGDGRPSMAGSGMGTDPAGYSRSPRTQTARPPFDEAAFDLGSNGVTQRIVLHDR